MDNPEEQEEHPGDIEIVRHYRKRAARGIYGPDPAEQKKVTKPRKRRRPFRKLIFLFVVQIILLTVWATLFFTLGMLTQYEMIPYLPRVVEALRVLLTP